jgi:hypothetical protein
MPAKVAIPRHRRETSNSVMGTPDITDHPQTPTHWFIASSNHIPIDFHPRLKSQPPKPLTGGCGVPRRHRWIWDSSAVVLLENDRFLGRSSSRFRVDRPTGPPATLDSTVLSTTKTTVEDVLPTFGQYMRGCFQRDIRFQDRLKASFSSFSDVSFGYAADRHEQASRLGQVSPSAKFSAGTIDPYPGPAIIEEFIIRLMRLIPQAYVVKFQTSYSTNALEELLVAMPNIERCDSPTLIFQAGSCCQRRGHTPTRTSSLRFDP